MQRNKIYSQCACFCNPLLATIPKSWRFESEKFYALIAAQISLFWKCNNWISTFLGSYFAISHVQNIPQYQSNHGFCVTNSTAQDLLASESVVLSFFSLGIESSRLKSLLNFILYNQVLCLHFLSKCWKTIASCPHLYEERTTFKLWAICLIKWQTNQRTTLHNHWFVIGGGGLTLIGWQLQLFLNVTKSG